MPAAALADEGRRHGDQLHQGHPCQPRAVRCLLQTAALATVYETPLMQMLEIVGISKQAGNKDYRITFTRPESKTEFFSAGGIILEEPGVLRLTFTPIDQLHPNAGMYGPISLQTSKKVHFSEELGHEIAYSITRDVA